MTACCWPARATIAGSPCITSHSTVRRDRPEEKLAYAPSKSPLDRPPAPTGEKPALHTNTLPHQPPSAGALHTLGTESTRSRVGWRLRRQRQQRVERARVVVDRRARVADRAQPLGHRVDAEVGELAVGHLVPREVAGDARVEHRPDGVARRHRVVLRVLVVVDEYRAGRALVPPPR